MVSCPNALARIRDVSRHRKSAVSRKALGLDETRAGALGEAVVVESLPSAGEGALFALIVMPSATAKCPARCRRRDVRPVRARVAR
jgi:hypothetical protein